MSANAPNDEPETAASDLARGSKTQDEHMSRTFFARIERGNNLTKCGAKTNPRDTAMLIAAQARACVDCPTLQVVGPQSTNQVRGRALSCAASGGRQTARRIHTEDHGHAARHRDQRHGGGGTRRASQVYTGWRGGERPPRPQAERHFFSLGPAPISRVCFHPSPLPPSRCAPGDEGDRDRAHFPGQVGRHRYLRPARVYSLGRRAHCAH